MIIAFSKKSLRKHGYIHESKLEDEFKNFYDEGVKSKVEEHNNEILHMKEQHLHELKVKDITIQTAIKIMEEKVLSFKAESRHVNRMRNRVVERESSLREFFKMARISLNDISTNALSGVNTVDKISVEMDQLKPLPEARSIENLK